MARQLAWALAILLLIPASGRAAVCGAEGARQAQQRPRDDKDRKADQPRRGPSKWWIESKDRAELAISDEQSARIEAIWQAGLKRRIEARETLEKLEAALSKMMPDPAVDEAAVIAQIDRVEAARGAANKERVLMLYRMNRVLSPEQRQKLDAKAKAMREQRDGRRGGGSSSR
jgi:Spy/CpxP family protein refolding chaperone